MDEFQTPPEPVRAVATSQPAQAHASMARIGLLGIAVAALLAVAILAFGYATSPASTLAAGSGKGNGNKAPVANTANGRGPAGPGVFGLPRLGLGVGGISITAISGNSISLATADGWTRTITVDAGTKYSKGGATIALGDLKVGDRIAFRETKEADGSFTIDGIVVVLPRVAGEITAIDGSTITIKDRAGTTSTIKVSGDTTYTLNRNGASLSDLKVGMLLVAEGTKNDDGSLAAINVHAGDKGFGRGLRGDHPFRGGPWAPGAGPGGSAAPDASSTAS